ncbi:MAG: glycosyltransferase family 2 protein [Mycoplasmatales bacterium]
MNRLTRYSNKFEHLKTYTFNQRPLVKEVEHSFTVITAMYNCVNYLEAYFESLMNQTYNTAKIEIVLINDGSTDNWHPIVNKYSDYLRVHIIEQRNTGQAIARSVGLTYAQNEYVSFIDADDFVNENYFREINRAICANPNSHLFVSQLHYFLEETNEIKNWHYLKYRFNERKVYFEVDLLKHPKFFIMHMSSCVFNRKIIEENELVIRDIKPQFEDTFFVNEYLMFASEQVIFVTSAIYLYRKRSEHNSTIDKVHLDKRRYESLLKEGYIELLKYSIKRTGRIPKYLKEVVKYDLAFNVDEYRKLEKNQLTVDEKLRTRYLEQIKRLLEHK